MSVCFFLEVPTYLCAYLGIYDTDDVYTSILLTYKIYIHTCLYTSVHLYISTYLYAYPIVFLPIDVYTYILTNVWTNVHSELLIYVTSLSYVHI